MASMRIDGFDRDAGHRGQCTKGGVPIETIEPLFEQAVHVLPDPRHSTTGTRFLAITTESFADERPLNVVVNWPAAVEK
jgi:uncharacterized DUF497 family protein